MRFDTFTWVNRALGSVSVSLRRVSRCSIRSGFVERGVVSTVVRVALLSGAAMMGVNPKNLALTVAGAAAILELDQSGGRKAMALVVFTAIAVSLLVLEVMAYALAPVRAAGLLGRARTFTLRREGVVVNGVLVALAVFFFTRGLLDLLK